MNDGSKVISSLLIGAAAGFVTGLLIAPQSGDETRQQVADTTERLREDLRKQSEKSTEILDEVKGSAEDLVDEVREKLNIS